MYIEISIAMTSQLLRPNHSFAGPNTNRLLGQSTNKMTRPDVQKPSHAAMRSSAWKCLCLTWSVCKSSNDGTHAPALPTRPQRSTFDFLAKDKASRRLERSTNYNQQSQSSHQLREEEREWREERGNKREEREREERHVSGSISGHKRRQ